MDDDAHASESVCSGERPAQSAQVIQISEINSVFALLHRKGLTAVGLNYLSFYYCYCFYVDICYNICLLHLCAYCSRTFELHRLRLSDELQTLRDLPDSSPSDKEKLEQSLEVLDHCVNVIVSFTELKPFAMLGFKVESSMLFTFISAGLSFFGVLFSVYTTAGQ
jgi:hypothetical protein